MNRAVTDVPPPTAGSLRELASTFLRLGLTAFGGPAAHIALFRHEFVVRRLWLTEQRYLDLLATANVLPGPTSTEVAIAIGHDRAGLRGMLVSGVLFILPASLLVLVLAVLYERFGTLPEVQPLLYGMQPVVVAIVVHALVGLARAALRSMIAAAIAVAATALAVLGVDPILVLAAGGAAAALARLAVLGSGDRSVAGLLALPGMLGAGGATGAGAGTIGAAAGGGAAATAGTFAGAIGLVPLFLVFLKIGLVVFGSGYVLLAFLRADLVVPGLITDRQVLDAVAVGQVTPGPIFTAATFIGYLLGGVPGAAVATVAIFLPSFVLVGLVHPIVPRIRASAPLSAILDGVIAAALGLMAAVTFELGRVALIDVATVAIAFVALILLLRSHVNPVILLAGGALAGLAARMVGWI